MSIIAKIHVAALTIINFSATSPFVDNPITYDVRI